MCSLRRSSDKKWFDYTSYARPEDLDAKPYQCIAPTLAGTRCKLRIKDFSHESDRVSRKHILGSTPGSERDKLIGRFLISHCCQRYHRDKLEADTSGCLETLIDRYVDTLSKEVRRQTTKPCSPRDTTKMETPSNLANSTTSLKSEDAESTNPSGGVRLRSGRVLNRRSESPVLGPRRYFVPYKSNYSESVHKKLVQDISSKEPEKGEVYSFTWPSYPGFVKIGFTRNTGRARMNGQWAICHPGAVLQKSIFTEYPERLERLIHLQLVQHRRKIANCNVCHTSHIEWFEASIDEMNRVIDDWTNLMKKEPLYNSERQLTAEWHYRISKTTGPITAQALLSILDDECTVEHVSDELPTERMRTSRVIDSSPSVKVEPAQSAVFQAYPTDTIAEHPARSRLDHVTIITSDDRHNQTYPLARTALGRLDVRDYATDSDIEAMIKGGVFDDPTSFVSSDVDGVRDSEEITSSSASPPTLTRVPPSPSSVITAHMIPEVIATAVKIVQQQDQMLSFFQEFMSLLQPVDALPPLTMTSSMELDTQVSEAPIVV